MFTFRFVYFLCHAYNLHTINNNKMNSILNGIEIRDNSLLESIFTMGRKLVVSKARFLEISSVILIRLKTFQVISKLQRDLLLNLIIKCYVNEFFRYYLNKIRFMYIHNTYRLLYIHVSF